MKTLTTSIWSDASLELFGVSLCKLLVNLFCLIVSLMDAMPWHQNLFLIVQQQVVSITEDMAK